ncbi:potassium channel subfamily K member 18 [Oryzias melastigma]|uniref:potassium channel subfamily K member 18 n=1 Tax=Oryzias melastigma TaxID=30732 RepID=UPI000CF7FF20|nr:potassium channel subfamily K member 18 [Oryzias melastigma]
MLVKKRMSAGSEKCAAPLWRVFPHLALCGTLVAYAALGALVFQRIEGGNKPSKIQEEYREFLGEVVDIVRNHSENTSCSHGCLVKHVENKMKNFNSIWFQNPDYWTFFGSMFFCCTVFTTVGYGEIYPVTLSGKVVCVLYAMVGIPLMLLVILDVGDFLALLMTRAYVQAHAFFKDLRSQKWSPGKAQDRASDTRRRGLDDGTFVFSHDVVALEPLDIRQVLRSQADVRHKSIQLQNNKEIFEKILARDNLQRKGPLLRTFSCPELNQLPNPPKGFTMWDFTGLGDGMDKLDVPFVLILFVVFAYICLGGLILPLWEKDFRDFDPYYFCFITLTTIGFGDIIPKHPKYFMLISLFIIVGMAIMSMAFKLSQTRIVNFYRKCIKLITRGNYEVFNNKDKKLDDS